MDLPSKLGPDTGGDLLTESSSKAVDALKDAATAAIDSAVQAYNPDTTKSFKACLFIRFWK
jgi:hypothetical protein